MSSVRLHGGVSAPLLVVLAVLCGLFAVQGNHVTNSGSLTPRSEALLMESSEEEGVAKTVHTFTKTQQQLTPSRRGGPQGLRRESAPAKKDTSESCSVDSLTRNATVDVVFTWVNQSDCDWFKVAKKYGAVSGECPTKPSDNLYGEIRYGLRALEKSTFFKQINKIYVVHSPYHGPPTFLKKDHPKLKFVTHKDIFAEGVDSFNSFGIYSRLHKIPGLKNYYIAFDDDYFVGKHAHLDHFYDWQEMKPFFMMASWTVEPKHSESGEEWAKSMANNSIKLNHLFGPRERKAELHIPFMYVRCVVEQLEWLFDKEFKETMRHPMRNSEDINLPFFYQNYLIDTKRATFRTSEGKDNIYMELHAGNSHEKVNQYVEEVRRRNPAFLNVQGYDSSDQDLIQKIEKFYQEQYPDKSSFESK
eukprot:GFYU01006403.1.p1 GENE.GFYU01006403.1~~GFYU01006403.1.p1  ORF type:complete len:416 (-),score=108.49 GFYU01006403.1:128-1375(-)